MNGTQGQYEILMVNALANIRGCFLAHWNESTRPPEAWSTLLARYPCTGGSGQPTGPSPAAHASMADSPGLTRQVPAASGPLLCH